MSDCPSHTELEDFLTERLPADSESRLLTHLESCSACQQLLESLTAGIVGNTGRSRADPAATLWTEGDERKYYPLPSRIAQYSVIRELGHGGMGVVYLAEQANLRRLVALKVIRHGINATPEELHRFRAEAEAVAQLQHPNIVQIHDVGGQDGLYYLALEYVSGGSLDRQLAGTPQEPRAAAQLIERLARAIEHAHRRGILHRDLKPANILMSGEWPEPSDPEQTDAISLALRPWPAAAVPKITDFGLAKRLEPGDARTQSGLVLGTPSYIAPEQASGKPEKVTHSVDIYGLGALLYETLTGRPPFKGATPLSTLEQVASQDPVAPSRFQRQIPRDLETICLKCLEKRPGNRYASAEALADDLGRFLSGRPIVARPVGLWGRVCKWATRRPIEASLAAAVLAVTMMGLTGIVWQWRNAVAERDAARQQWYRANIVAAEAALQVHDSLAARRSLDTAPAEFAQWEWHHFHSQLDGASKVLSTHQGAVVGMAFSPDGGRLVSISSDHTVRLWEAATGRELVVARGDGGSIGAVGFSPDGSRLASGSDDGTVRLWEAHTGHPLVVCLGHPGPVRALAFSPDCRRLVSAALPADDRCRLWDAATGTLLAVLPAPATAHGLTFTPDGTRIVCCQKEAIHVVDATFGKEVIVRRVAGATVFCCAVSRDGRRLVTGWDYPDNAVRLWDLGKGELLAVMTGHRNRVGSVAFSPDGTRIASASLDQTVRVWDAASGQPVAVLRGHTSHVISAIFSPDGRRIVSTSDDGTLRLWETARGEPISVLQGHAGGVGACAYSPDGKWLASASLDHTVRLWDMARVERNGALRGHESFVYDVAFSPDGVHIGSAAWDNSVRLWDVNTGRQAALFQGPGRRDRGQRRSDDGLVALDPGSYMLALAWSPDGSQLVTGSRDSKVQFWDVKAGDLRRTVQLPGDGVDSLAFSSDGKRVAAALGNAVPGLKGDCSVYILDAECGETLRTLAGHIDGVLAVRFAPDGRRLASAGFDKTVRVWDAATGEPLAVLPGHGDSVAAVAFSKDGRLLASASHDRTVRLWDAHTLRHHDTLLHGSIVYAVAFSPDGMRLAAGCEDNTIRLWDVATRREVGELRGHTAYVHAIAFSPDGTRLVSASGDFTIRVWDTLSPRERSYDGRR
jgi:WD40 repeat protein/serine/threonine protein kinase